MDLERISVRVRKLEVLTDHIVGALINLEEDDVNEAEQLAALEAGLGKVEADLATAQGTLQTELNELSAAHPGIDLSKVSASVTALDTAVQAVGALKPAIVPAPAPAEPAPPASPAV
jgi:hypothetical protein